MADSVIVYPGDIVQLNGSRQRGRVLDWELIERPMMAKQMSKAFVPVAPSTGGHTLFWPLNGITLIERHIQPSQPRLLDDFGFKF